MEIGHAVKLELIQPRISSSLEISGNPDGTLTVTNLAGGNFSITVSTPAGYAGTYTTDVDGSPLTAALLDGGPACLVLPVIAGTALPGNSLTAVPGLWIYDAANTAPALSYLWESDNVAIDGATSQIFDVSASEQGTDLNVVEQAAGTNGTRAFASNAVSVPSAAGFSASYITQTGAVTSVGGGPATYAGLELGAADANREIFVVTGNRSGASPGVSAVTVSGISASLVVSSTQAGVNVEIWRAAVPAGTTGDVVVTYTGGGSIGAGVALYRVVSGTVGAAVFNNTETASTGPVTVDINTTTGGAVIAAGLVENWVSAWAWSGVTENFDIDLDPDTASSADRAFFSGGIASVSAGEAPRTVEGTTTGGGNNDKVAAVSVAIS